jgi:cell division protein FtsZ
VQETAHPEANIIFGAMVDESLEDEVWVTVVATGYEQARSSSTLREPAGEPRVTRTREREPQRSATPRSTDVDVPEFIPRF